ncbi:MAG: alcohol dehydrogenase catalytic domain-containing protein [Candidatus Gallimonas sp.]
MNVWNLTAPNRLEKTDAGIPTEAEGEIKVRVTKVLVNRVDADIYNGTVKVVYPLVPGRFAIGRVASENGPVGLEKGARVVLHTFLPEKDAGTAKKDFSADEYGVCGQTVNGFLRDFVCVPADEVTAVPDSVSDDSALLLELVALAKAAIDALDVRKGSHVAVFGGDMLGLFICQLLIYQQVSPILIDNRTNHLDFAKKCGVYYTCPADDSLVGEVARVTGGRLADGAIFITSSGPQNTSMPFRVSANGTRTVYCGFSRRALAVDLDYAIRKQISVCGLSNGADYLPTAVNLLVNKAIDLSSFRFRAFPAEKIAEELASFDANAADASTREVISADLI